MTRYPFWGSRPGIILFFCLLFSLAVPFLCTADEITDKASQDKMVTMDFQDVEISQVIRFIAEITDRNFIISEGLKGKVTIVTPTPITPEEAYQVFESILAVHRYSAVKNGTVYKILPAKNATEEGKQEPLSKDDIPSREGVTSTLLYLKHANANTLVPLLKPLMHEWASIGAYVPKNALILVDSNATINKIKEIVQGLDVSEENAAWKLFPLEHGNATQIEKVLNSVFADFNGLQPRSGTGIKVFSDTRINALLVVTPAGKLEEVAAIIERLDTRTETGTGNLHLYYPKNSKADIIAKVLQDLLTKVKDGAAGEQSTTFSRQVSVVAEATSNTLLVSATPQDYEMLLPIIKGLDVRSLQVHIEALVLEISAERGAEFGIEWRSPETLNNDSIRSIGGTNFGTINKLAYAGVNDAANNPLATASGLVMGIVKGTVTYGGTEYLNLGALVRALQSDTDINILATPNILVVDNEQAEILVGQNVPFRTGSNTGTTTATTFERKDIGLKLRVKPQILDGGKLRLSVYQEQSSLAPSITIGSNETEVVTNKRSIETTVLMDNTHLVVLGGLIREESQERVNMVPCLGSLPGTGELFKNTSRSTIKRNMMVFLRPEIINTYDDLLGISSKKYRSFRNDWGNRESKGSTILPATPPKPLPENLGDN